MPRPGLTPASRPAPNRGHRGRGAEEDRKQLKPITTQDPYSTEPCLTERECVWAAGRGPSETGFGGAEKELLCLPGQAPRSHFRLNLLLPLASAILPSADPGVPCFPSGRGVRNRFHLSLKAKWPPFSRHCNSHATTPKGVGCHPKKQRKVENGQFPVASPCRAARARGFGSCCRLRPTEGSFSGAKGLQMR